jgi:hypothetical protein
LGGQVLPLPEADQPSVAKVITDEDDPKRTTGSDSIASLDPLNCSLGTLRLIMHCNLIIHELPC